MKKIITVLVAASLMTTVFSFMASQEDPWKVPEKYEKMKNPVVADEASLTAGKELYSEHCVSCHGKKGKGDGYKSENINTHQQILPLQHSRNNRMAHYYTKSPMVIRICPDLRKGSLTMPM